LIVAHEVTNVGNDTAHLANTALAAKTALQADKLEAVADRGYFDGEKILACDQAGITVTLPKPQRSGAKSEGRFGKQDFVYLADENVYRCPAGEKLKYRFTAVEQGQTLHRYWTDACRTCAIKAQCTTGRERRITRWEHEEVVEAVQERLDRNPDAMRTRRVTVEHPFGTMKMRMGATHFLMKTLPKVATEMALHVLAYNLTRVLNIVGVKPIMATVGARCALAFAFLAGPRALTMLWAASVCVADEIGKICSKSSPSFVALQTRPVKDPVSALSHDQDPMPKLMGLTFERLEPPAGLATRGGSFNARPPLERLHGVTRS
jgi:hypothetical protein